MAIRPSNLPALSQVFKMNVGDTSPVQGKLGALDQL